MGISITKRPGAEPEPSHGLQAPAGLRAERAQIRDECPYNLDRNPKRECRPCLSPAAFSLSSLPLP
jgi:hypothetical protein